MQEDIRDSEEQVTLRQLWLKSHKKASPTTACPLCLPDCTRKSAYFFERGTVSGENGETLVAMRCNNCSFIRVSKPRTQSTEITPAQQRSIDKVQRFFTAKGVLKVWKVERNDFGVIVINVETGTNVWTDEGGYFFIGGRGSIEVVVVYGLFTTAESKRQTAEHYAFMLDGKVNSRI